jgi:hypothetical protein
MPASYKGLKAAAAAFDRTLWPRVCSSTTALDYQCIPWKYRIIVGYHGMSLVGSGSHRIVPLLIERQEL